MHRTLFAIALVICGCYHYSFEQSVARGPVIRHEVRVPTWLNGFIGTGTVDTRRFCERPVRTELQVRATDVLLSIVTLLIYTPHTLYVTCPAQD